MEKITIHKPTYSDESDRVAAKVEVLNEIKCRLKEAGA